MLFDVGDEVLFGALFAFAHAVEVLHGEFGIDAEKPCVGFENGVHNAARFEAILEMESVFGKGLTDHFLKNFFADATPKFGGLKKFLERFDTPADFGHFPQIFLDIRDDPGRVI